MQITEQRNLQEEIGYIQMEAIMCPSGLFRVRNINTSGKLPNLFGNPNRPKVGITVQYSCAIHVVAIWFANNRWWLNS